MSNLQKQHRQEGEAAASEEGQQQQPHQHQQQEQQEPQQPQNQQRRKEQQAVVHTDADQATTTTTIHVRDFSASAIFDTAATGQPIILESLWKLDQMLALNTTTRTRVPDQNLDHVHTPKGDFYVCNLATLLDFTHSSSSSSSSTYVHALEAAGAIALAAHHMNSGIDWIVPELKGLHQRCPIRFTTEFADTQYDAGVALGHVIDMTDRVVNKPCAFIGATRSEVSIPTAIVTGIRGYPQVSPQSTSEQLDDIQQFPLFARTVPGDVDNAIPIVKYFRTQLQATHLAVLHVNNGYGNSLADDLKRAALVHTPDLEIRTFEVPTSEHISKELVNNALEEIKDSQFSYIFAVLLDDIIDMVMEQAVKRNVAGTGIHNWFFSNTFEGVEERTFEKDGALHQAFRGVGRMQVSGGHTSMPTFETFACNLRTFRSSTPDLDYLGHLLPDHIDKSFLYDTHFMDPIPVMADRTSPAYEAAIALGLAACDVILEDEPLSGQNHFDKLVTEKFRGVESDVAFSHETGTRDANTSLFALENEIEEEIWDPITNSTKIKFHAVVTDIYSHEKWDHLEDYTFSDGTSTVLPDLTPPEDVEHQYIHTPLKIVAGTMYLIIIALTIRFAVWTERNLTTRVVRASQPLFLRVILVGVVTFASAILPLNVDDRLATIQGCTIACNFFYWLLFLGFSIMFSGLFTKIYRVNQIMNNPQKFRRVKVTVQDVIRPMVAIIGVNLVVLIVMTAASPSEWQIVVTDEDEHERPTETFGHCTTHDQIPYYITLGSINFLALLFSIQQAYNTRKLATEFSESRYIFYAMIGIVVALLQGIPVLVLVRDSPDVQDFIKCTVIFVTCCSVLLFMFIPKMKFLAKQRLKSRSMRMRETVKISGLGPNPDVFDESNRVGMQSDAPVGNQSGFLQTPTTQSKPSAVMPPLISGLSVLSSQASSGNGSSDEGGLRIQMMTHDQLAEENKMIRDYLKSEKVELHGTLATTSSASNGSSSDGMLILARKSPAELMAENKALKKIVKKHRARQERLQKRNSNYAVVHRMAGDDDDDDDDDDDENQEEEKEEETAENLELSRQLEQWEQEAGRESTESTEDESPASSDNAGEGATTGERRTDGGSESSSSSQRPNNRRVSFQIHNLIEETNISTPPMTNANENNEDRRVERAGILATIPASPRMVDSTGSIQDCS